ncbi:replication factor C subunit 3/5 [Nematocida sp. AWRm80]|nr:replication factor C subunit 3/5 [Nematocida sp. AWRm80]
MLQEKYKPRELQELEEYIPCVKLLRSFDVQTFPSVVFYGIEGAGKRTLLSALIKNLFGRSPVYMSYTSKIEVSSSKTLEVEILECEECIEVRVGGLGIYDKKVLQKIAKDISETRSIKGLLDTSKGPRSTKLLVIPDGENLSIGAQMALRRIMEIGASNFRLAILTTSINTFIDAFKSRFLLCRVPSLTDTQIEEVISKIVLSENQSLDQESIKEIVRESNGNLRKALALADISIHTQTQTLQLSWEESLINLAHTIITKPSVEEIAKAREVIYSVLERNVPGSEILKMLVMYLFKKEHSLETSSKITKYAAIFDSRLRQGTRELFHIEAFISTAMCIYANQPLSY